MWRLGEPHVTFLFQTGFLHDDVTVMMPVSLDLVGR
jgi:hypothetical protein